MKTPDEQEIVDLAGKIADDQATLLDIYALADLILKTYGEQNVS